MSLAFSRHFLASQFYTVPELKQSFADQTVIVTGSNTGLGFEAAKIYHALGASLVILAVRDVKKGEAAKAKILRQNAGEIRVIQLDMSDNDSIVSFTKTVAKLPRVDVLLANAGMTQPNWQLSKAGIEMALSVNFYGTMFLTLLMIPILQASRAKHTGLTPRITVVTSEAHHLTSWGQKSESFDDLHEEDKFVSSDRYNVTKLLQVLYIRELARHVDPTTGPIISLANPGMNKSDFDRNMPRLTQIILRAVMAILARESEVGAKTMVWPTIAGNEGHGKYSLDCTFNERAVSRFARSSQGIETGAHIFNETNTRLESIHPGVTRPLVGR